MLLYSCCSIPDAISSQHIINYLNSINRDAFSCQEPSFPTPADKNTPSHSLISPAERRLAFGVAYSAQLSRLIIDHYSGQHLAATGLPRGILTGYELPNHEICTSESTIRHSVPEKRAVIILTIWGNSELLHKYVTVLRIFRCALCVCQPSPSPCLIFPLIQNILKSVVAGHHTKQL